MNGFPALGVLETFALILVVNAYGEETGWRGFALPRFRRRHNELEASFLLSLPWVLWHIPTFFLDTGYRAFSPLMIPGFALGIFAGAWCSPGCTRARGRAFSSWRCGTRS